MVDHQLPAYLQNRTVEDFTDYASDGLGSSLPPRVSIQGNCFTLIDGTGLESRQYQPMPTMDCVILDRSNVTCKMYFAEAYMPGSDAPPTCWSSNGVGPSRDSLAPQARTCVECQWNVRGSAISKISGASIKACRDEYYLAILLPSIPNMLFRFVLTPGSFDNWNKYAAKFKNSNVKISMVVTRFSFVPKVNGVIDFQSISYVDEATNNVVQKALIEKATDVLCGRLDAPRTAALPAAAERAQIAMVGDANIPHQVQQPVPFAQGAASQIMPQTFPQGSPTSQKPLGTSTTPNIVVQSGTAPVASPSEAAPQQRRRRRTAAEMAMANGGAPAGQAPTAAPQAAPQAPFPHSTPQELKSNRSTFPDPNQGSNNFGIQQGQPAAANPELATMLDDFFKPGT